MTGVFASLFAETILSIFTKRRQQIADYAALAGFDLGGNGHPRRQVHELVLDLHASTVKRDACSVDRSLVLAPVPRTLTALLRFVLRWILRIVTPNRVLRHAEHLPVQQPIPGEIEGRHLD